MTLGLRTLSASVTAVGRYAEDSSTARQTAIKDALNAAYMEAAQSREWNELLVTDETGLRQKNMTVKSLVDGEAEMPLPWHCLRVKSLTYQNLMADPIDIVEASDGLDMAGSQLTTAGRPVVAWLTERTAQWQKYTAATAGQLQASSSAANANAVVRVHYEKATGYTGQSNWEDMTSANWLTTPVSTNSTCQLGWPIRRVVLPSTWTGSFNIVDPATSSKSLVALQAIEEPPTNSNSTQRIWDRLLLRFWPVPDDAYALTIAYWKRPLRLTEDEDQPIIPVSDFIEMKAAATILRIKGNYKGAANFDKEAGEAFAGASIGGTLQHKMQAKPAGGNILRQTGMWRRRW